MDGKNFKVGRPREDDPKYIQTVRLKISTLLKIDEIAEKIGQKKSYVIQQIIDNAIEAHYNLLNLQK